MLLFTLQLQACVSRAAMNPTPPSPPTTYHPITTMAVSFYRLGATQQLLSYGIRKFERGVSEEPELLSLVSLFFSRHIILPPSIASYTETTLSLGPHLAVFKWRTVIPPATPIRRRVVPLSMVGRQVAPVALPPAVPHQLRQTPTLASSTPIILPHGPRLVARIPCRIRSLPQRSSPLSWSAARPRSEDRRVMRVLWDFQTLPQRSHRLHRQP